MYKFTNGLVFFTEKDRDRAIKAGYKLVEQKLPDKDVGNMNEVTDETSETTNRIVSKSNTKPKKPTRKD